MKEGFLTFFIPLFYLFPFFIFFYTKANQGFGFIFVAILGLVMGLAGLFIWGGSYFNLGIKSFTVVPKAKVLETSGFYCYFRHPIYLGITLTFFGLSLCLGSFWGLFYSLLVIIPLNVVRARKEEKVLIQKFGQKYLDYQKTTLF